MSAMRRRPAPELEQRLTEVLAEARACAVSCRGSAAPKIRRRRWNPVRLRSPPAPGSCGGGREPPTAIDSNTVQRVIQVGQSLGLEPLYMPTTTANRRSQGGARRAPRQAVAGGRGLL